VLNYGRLLAKVRYEDAKLSEAIFALQNKALEAQREVEDGIIGYLKQGDIVGSLEKAAASSRRALELGIVQYNEGTATYLWVYNLEQNFARIADGLIAARGNQLLSLVDTYRSLGGGWNLPLPETEAAASAADPADVLPVPRPNPINRIEDLPLPRVRQPVPGDGQ
jgi:outer membrane protein TolC